MKRALVAAAAALMFGAAACSKDATSPKSPLSGSWMGTTQSGFTLSLVLSVDSRKNVTGTATFTYPGSTLGVLVTGSDNSPSVDLELYSQGFQPANLLGTITGPSAFSAQLFGSGFGGDSVKFVRE